MCSRGLLAFCGRSLALPRCCSRLGDEEAAFTHKGERPHGCVLGGLCAKLPVSTSDVCSVASIQDVGRQSDREGLEEPTEIRASPDHPERSTTTGLANWVLRNPLFVSSWLSTLVICIPLRYGAGFEDPLGISLLLALWTATQSLQKTIRTCTLLPLRPKFRIALSVVCNPVLWTAIGVIAYAAAESQRSSRPIGAVLSTLERNTTFADLVMHRSPSDSGTYIDFSVSRRDDPANTDYAHRPTPPVAAGDVANAVLSAGLVCWGLKLWEYRRRLLSSAGLAVLLVSCAAALANVLVGPLLAKAVLGPHSRPRYDLAFAARTVTLALGAPAVARLGGDVGLNAAMVVVNGIACQMLLGLGVGEWLGRLVEAVEARGREQLRRRRSAAAVRREKASASNPGVGDDRTAEKGIEPGNSARGSTITSSPCCNDVVAVGAARLSPGEAGPHPPEQHGGPHEPAGRCRPGAKRRSTTTIASGITVGINAAAMGTAHLYEAGSDAAPYSALAMTVFGVATVGFAMIPQLGGWVAVMVQ